MIVDKTFSELLVDLKSVVDRMSECIAKSEADDDSEDDCLLPKCSEGTLLKTIGDGISRVGYYATSSHLLNKIIGNDSALLAWANRNGLDLDIQTILDSDKHEHKYYRFTHIKREMLGTAEDSAGCDRVDVLTKLCNERHEEFDRKFLEHESCMREHVQYASDVNDRVEEVFQIVTGRIDNLAERIVNLEESGKGKSYSPTPSTLEFTSDILKNLREKSPVRIGREMVHKHFPELRELAKWLDTYRLDHCFDPTNQLYLISYKAEKT